MTRELDYAAPTDINPTSGTSKLLVSETLGLAVRLILLVIVIGSVTLRRKVTTRQILNRQSNTIMAAMTSPLIYKDLHAE